MNSSLAPGVLPAQQTARSGSRQPHHRTRPDTRAAVPGRQPRPAPQRHPPTAFKASFLTGPAATVTNKLDELGMARVDLRRPAILERTCICLVHLQERLPLPKTLCSKANPKSTTGHLDVFTRGRHRLQRRL